VPTDAQVARYHAALKAAAREDRFCECGRRLFRCSVPVGSVLTAGGFCECGFVTRLPTAAERHTLWARFCGGSSC
jgi:hypothetical protein